MPPTPSCDSQATGGSKNARNVLRVSCLDSLSKIYLFLSSPQWPAGFTPSHAIAEKNLALLSGGGREASDPLLRLAGHWWEQKRSKCAASLMSGFFVEDLLVFEFSPVACGFHAISRHRRKKSSFAKWGRARSLRPPPATRRPLVGAKTLETCCESHVWILCRRFTCF